MQVKNLVKVRSLSYTMNVYVYQHDLGVKSVYINVCAYIPRYLSLVVL